MRSVRYRSFDGHDFYLYPGGIGWVVECEGAALIQRHDLDGCLEWLGLRDGLALKVLAHYHDLDRESAMLDPACA